MTRATIGWGAFATVLVLLALVAGQRVIEQDVDPSAATSPAMTTSAATAVAEAHQGLLYGRITADGGATYEGRLRWGGDEEALESWIVETGDLGEVPEAELVARFRPDGVPPTTEPPKVQPQGGTYHGPPQVTITCPTDGSTAVFTTDLDDEPRWRLYAWPFWMGDPRLQARCGRLGYFDSEIVSYDFDVEMHWVIPEGTSPRRLPGQIQTWR